ncbi:hypothetical protein HJC23_001815 [Cyclotella cryptica]|uniref:Uncharacterized protein n=1 Tax=Cyclotella cryptica TaxID=29204 RepID=A0ABD3PH57_9STRA
MIYHDPPMTAMERHDVTPNKWTAAQTHNHLPAHYKKVIVVTDMTTKQPIAPSSKAPSTHCMQFLLETLSNDENSFHLRRAAFSLLKEILERSSDARAHLSNGSLLMDYIAMIQRVNVVKQEEAPSSNINGGVVDMSRNMFQQEELEIIHFLVERFGKFYPKFLVALRITGEISIGALPSSYCHPLPPVLGRGRM